MASAGKIFLRVVFVACMVLIFVGDYTGLLGKLFESAKSDQDADADADAATNNRPSPRPTNPGYGDPKTEIDLDADIEDESIKTIGKNR